MTKVPSFALNAEIDSELFSPMYIRSHFLNWHTTDRFPSKMGFGVLHFSVCLEPTLRKHRAFFAFAFFFLGRVTSILNLPTKVAEIDSILFCRAVKIWEFE